MRIPKSRPAMPGTWREALDEFLLHKQAEAVAHRTLADYSYWVGRFFRCYPKAWKSPESLHKATLEHFSALSSKAPATYNLALRNLRAFFNWCVAQEYLPANPVAKIKKRKDDGRARDVDAGVITQILDLCDRRSFAGLRDYALALLQLDSGIRPGEALQLCPGDFNLRALEVRIPQGAAKGRKSRTVVFSVQVAKAISKLIAVRPPEWSGRVPVFCSQDGTALHESSWAHRMNKYSKKIGVRVTPYDLRHSSAIMALRNGASAFAVQRQLGHADMQMTRRYVNLVESDLHREHSQASPVQKLFPRGKRIRKV